MVIRLYTPTPIDRHLLLMFVRFDSTQQSSASSVLVDNGVDAATDICGELSRRGHNLLTSVCDCFRHWCAPVDAYSEPLFLTGRHMSALCRCIRFRLVRLNVKLPSECHFCLNFNGAEYFEIAKLQNIDLIIPADSRCYIFTQSI